MLSISPLRPLTPASVSCSDLQDWGQAEEGRAGSAQGEPVDADAEHAVRARGRAEQRSRCAECALTAEAEVTRGRGQVVPKCAPASLRVSVRTGVMGEESVKTVHKTVLKGWKGS